MCARGHDDIDVFLPPSRESYVERVLFRELRVDRERGTHFFRTLKVSSLRALLIIEDVEVWRVAEKARLPRRPEVYEETGDRVCARPVCIRVQEMLFSPVMYVYRQRYFESGAFEEAGECLDERCVVGASAGVVVAGVGHFDEPAVLPILNGTGGIWIVQQTRR